MTRLEKMRAKRNTGIFRRNVKARKGKDTSAVRIDEGRAIPKELKERNHATMSITACVAHFPQNRAPAKLSYQQVL